ncbi:transcription factor HHO5-like isoform X2 [Gastrolobium bilobum]|uniref:transcription factor HHO5-like isoform X2 n=1 Tax=Gastrolobium bilobum TaxID=150636 RepID=UPI002AB31E3F|nr:transcription factor HHO5-like isoform X2 [Gastrolobium bilobum]
MELSLDLCLTFAPRTISELLGEVSKSKEGSQKMTMLEDYVKKLEDEMRKIEAFKRELPLCMILVNYAIARLKEEIEGCMRMQDEPVVEELMPLMKTNFEGKGSLNMWKEISDKKNWMSSAQLWSVETKLRTEEDNWSVPENPIEPPNETNNNGRAFLAFSGNSKTVKRDEKEVSHFPKLSLMTPEFEQNHRKSKRGCGGSHDSSLITSKIKGQPQQQQQNPRKQRRCWSPELHRRFVDALHQLGGPQVATPKQIRELMQVGGLTNDEVKSHLQVFYAEFYVNANIHGNSPWKYLF